MIEPNPTPASALSDDAKAIIEAINSDWIGRGFHLGIGLSAWFFIVAVFCWILWSLYGAGGPLS